MAANSRAVTFIFLTVLIDTIGFGIVIPVLPQLIVELDAVFLWQLGHQVLPATWAFYAQLKFAWSPAAVGASLAAVGVIMAVSQGWLTRVLVPRLTERRTAVLGLWAAILTYFAYAFGGVMSLFSLSAILGPPLFAQLLGRFSGPSAPVHFPGAAFVCAGVLAIGCLALLLRSQRAATLAAAATEPG